MNCKTKVTSITATLAAGSVTSPYYAQVNISKTLCAKVCKDQAPIFAPIFSLVGYSEVGTGQYVATIKVDGLASYSPCGSSDCATQSVRIRGSFTLPFSSEVAPTSVTISTGTTVNSIVTDECNNCSSSFVSETPLTLTVA